MPAMVLAANPATVTAVFKDTSDTTVDPGTVTVNVTRLDGTAVVTGAATTSGTGAAARTYLLTSTHTALLDTLTVTFASASLSQSVSETVEVVGAFLFTEAEARAFDGGAMTEAKVTDAALEEARARITDEFESICGVSFVPRYRLDTFSGLGYVNLALHRMKVTDIRSVEYRTSGAATWTAYDADDLADIYIEDHGWILRESRGTFLTGRRNIRIGYEHGFTQPPHDIKWAALKAARDELIPSNINDRAISITTEQGSEQLWTPNYSGRGAAVHKLLSVDTVLQRYVGYRVPVVA
jgi:hypothetical protein